MSAHASLFLSVYEYTLWMYQRTLFSILTFHNYSPPTITKAAMKRT